MKTFIFLFLCVLTPFFSNAQITDLIGSWHLVEFSVFNGAESETMNEDKLKEEGSVWYLSFAEPDQFKQTSNMSGSGNTESQVGTWKKTTDVNLIISLPFNGKVYDVDYSFELKGNVLILTRCNPTKTMKIVSTFNKN